MVGVTGSIPVPPTIFFLIIQSFGAFFASAKSPIVSSCGALIDLATKLRVVSASNLPMMIDVAWLASSKNSWSCDSYYDVASRLPCPSRKLRCSRSTRTSHSPRTRVASGVKRNLDDLLKGLDDKVLARKAAELLYHPYISRAGERGPFMDTAARSMFRITGGVARSKALRLIIASVLMPTSEAYRGKRRERREPP